MTDLSVRQVNLREVETVKNWWLYDCLWSLGCYLSILISYLLKKAVVVVNLLFRLILDVSPQNLLSNYSELSIGHKQEKFWWCLICRNRIPEKPVLERFSCILQFDHLLRGFEIKVLSGEMNYGKFVTTVCADC